MAKKKKTIDEQAQELINQLEASYEQWERQYKEGVGDPSWSDGCNLNLVRNHISYYKKQLQELQDFGWEGELPESFHRPLPEELSNDYMARKENIHSTALQVKQEVLESETYKKFNVPENKDHFIMVSFRSFCATLEKPVGNLSVNDYIELRRIGKEDYWLGRMERELAKE